MISETEFVVMNFKMREGPQGKKAKEGGHRNCKKQGNGFSPKSCQKEPALPTP